jgi:AcrR family transcriptional regulator
MVDKKREQYHHGNLRAALLEVATDMIAEAGIDSLTMRALSQRIGVSRTAPYRHFEDKAALLAGVAEEGFKRLHERMQTAIDQEEDILARFRKLGVTYIQFAVDHPTHYQLMFGRETAVHEAYPNLEAAGKAVFDLLVMTIQQAQTEHKIKAGDPRNLALVAWATVHGVASLVINQQIRDLTDLQELANFATRTLGEGLRV